MFYRDIGHRDLDRVQAVRAARDPIVAAQRGQPQRYGLIKSRSRHLHRVIDAIQIADRDVAGADGHKVSISPSPYLRPSFASRAPGKAAAISGAQLALDHKGISGDYLAWGGVAIQPSHKDKRNGNRRF